MCTVTYMPVNQDSFILTSNRDESPLRSPETIYEQTQDGRIYPREPQHGGTWICTDQKGRLVCLLNGAFVKHKHQPPYKRSRGLVVLDFFDAPSATHFFEHYNMEGIEPFTMVIFSENQLWELRWDEQKKHILRLDNHQPHIWSSCPLYPPAIQHAREQWFKDWLAKDATPSRENLLAFHQQAGTGDKENDLVMERYSGSLKTVSITSIAYQKGEVSMLYKDLIRKQEDLKMLTHV